MRSTIRCIAGIALLIALAGCFAPVTTREAQNIAQERLARYCKKNCGTFTMAGTQKIKNRWLVDFDAPRHKFTVTVEANGNTRVDTWNK